MSSKGGGTKPAANEVDWTTNDGVDLALLYFFKHPKFFASLSLREKVEKLSGCYAPQDNKMMYMVLSLEAGDKPQAVQMNKLRGKKVIGKAMADVVVRVINGRVNLNVEEWV